MKIELIEKLQDIHKSIKAFEPVVKEYIKDKTVPLEDRWEVFKSVPQGMLEDSWVMHYDFAGSEICWYDDHYIDKYASADNVNIIRHYEEKIGLDPGHYNYNAKVTQETVDQLKEDMLQSGVRYWENDW